MPWDSQHVLLFEHLSLSFSHCLQNSYTSRLFSFSFNPFESCTFLSDHTDLVASSQDNKLKLWTMKSVIFFIKTEPETSSVVHFSSIPPPVPIKPVPWIESMNRDTVVWEDIEKYWQKLNGSKQLTDYHIICCVLTLLLIHMHVMHFFFPSDKGTSLW